MATDQHPHCVAKAIFWRATGAVYAIQKLWLIARAFWFASSIGFVEPYTKFIMYSGHGRACNYIAFSRVKSRCAYGIRPHSRDP